jgi:hypothetical protein
MLIAVYGASTVFRRLTACHSVNVSVFGYIPIRVHIDFRSMLGRVVCLLVCNSSTFTWLCSPLLKAAISDREVEAEAVETGIFSLRSRPERLPFMTGRSSGCLNNRAMKFRPVGTMQICPLYLGVVPRQPSVSSNQEGGTLYLASLRHAPCQR